MNGSSQDNYSTKKTGRHRGGGRDGRGARGAQERGGAGGPEHLDALRQSGIGGQKIPGQDHDEERFELASFREEDGLRARKECRVLQRGVARQADMIVWIEYHSEESVCGSRYWH